MTSAVAVCGIERSAVESGVELVRSTGRWEPVPVCWPDLAAFKQAENSARGFLVLGATDSFRQHLCERPPNRPVIAIGGTPGPEVTCWLAKAPSAPVFSMLLSQLVEVEPSEPRTYRRKSDMIVGSSPSIRRLLHELDSLSPSTAAVLITGESGTGKELVAQALHFSGPRSAKRFVAINCGAIPEHLFEAELFGYQRGAFTGAVTARAGAFEAADGGTLFLDEIGELPMSMQVKLLRVLETQEVVRLGSTEPKKVDVRLVAATNRDLSEEVAGGAFRQDLYYRVRVCHVRCAPLRERIEDIPELLSHHLSIIAQRERRVTPVLTPAALEQVLSHAWPGNVRELVNTLHRALVLAEAGVIDTRHLDLPVALESPMILPYSEAKETFESQYYRRLLSATRGNVTLAAKMAQKTRKEIYDALKRHTLDAATFR